jgi:pimeloyl-ACP methyl ester carboxylesterase
MHGYALRLATACTLVFLLSDLAAGGAPRPPGKLIDVGGYRLHALVRGKGSPAVVFLNGAGDYSFVWSLVEPDVSRFARTIAYDRAGDAWSDLGPTPRTLRQESSELHVLLERAGVRPPVVLVGHSYGGLLARVYAEQYPGEVAGMVLVDATHENTVLSINNKPVRMRELATGRPVPAVQTMRGSPPRPPTEEDLRQFEEMRKLFGPPRIGPPFDRLPATARRLQLWAMANPKLSASTEGFLAEELQLLFADRQKRARPLGDMPLVVLAAGRSGGPPPGLSADEWEKIGTEKRQQKADLATLSTDATLVVAEQSGHHIHLESPRLVVDAVRRVVDAARRRWHNSPRSTRTSHPRVRPTSTVGSRVHGKKYYPSRGVAS